ncbi:MAG: hypothetical protein EBR23_15055 [Planctomycetia bacterium]|nr:hypothetical protein [Planctomycetia bacterium]
MASLIFKGDTLDGTRFEGIELRVERKLNTSECTEELIRSCEFLDDTIRDSWGHSEVLKQKSFFKYTLGDDNSGYTVKAKYEDILKTLVDRVSSGEFEEKNSYSGGRIRSTTVSYFLGTDFECAENTYDDEDDEDESC